MFTGGKSLTAVLVLVTVVGTVGPAVATHAAWQANTGVPEPSTRWDTTDYMFQSPNQGASEKVYFNGVLLKNDDFLVGVKGSYDLQLHGGSWAHPVVITFAAVLGFWRDCNKDGYIGYKLVPASQGSMGVYPRSLSPPDETICPPGSPYNPTNVGTNSPNGYIDEFRAIGPALLPPNPNAPPPKVCVPPSNPNSPVCVGSTATAEDPYDVSDPNTRVWADWNHPGGRHIYSSGLNPQPPGTYDDSDGTLKFLDTASGRTFTGTLGSTWTTKPVIGRCDDPKVFLGGPSSRLPVADRGTCGAWPLYQIESRISDRSPYADERDDPGYEPSPLVKVFDVSEDSGGSTADPCDDMVDTMVAGKRIAMPNVDPELHPNFLVEGSIQGTTTNVWRTNASTVQNNGAGGMGRCNNQLSGPDGLDDDVLEDEFTHRKPDDVLGYGTDQRYRLLAMQGFDYMPLDGAAMGVRGGLAGLQDGGAGWYGSFGWTGRPPRTGFGSTVAIHATWYADVACDSVRPTGGSCPTNNTAASAAGSLPARSQDKFTYGTDYCPAFTTGSPNVNPANDWDCSVTTWEKKRDQDNADTRAVIGDKYDLRDVDCYDNRLMGNVPGTDIDVPVRVGIADCTPTHE